MLRKTINYTNLDGKPVSEEYYFQITKAEAAKMSKSGGEDYGEQLKKLSGEKDGAKIMEAFERLLCDAVGQREDDLFIKDPKISRRFRYSGAYDALFEEIVDMPDFGLSLIRAIFPADAQIEIDKAMKEHGFQPVEIPSSGVIEGVAGDAAVQADKPQPTGLPEPTPFPKSLEAAVEHTSTTPQPGTDDDPAWLRESRSPTRQELMKMSKEEMQLVYKMREAGLIT